MKLKQLLPYRNHWLGLAMIWIVLSHSGIQFHSSFWNHIKSWGYGGVDICLFASGIGCYFSLDKDPDLLRFLKRRALRLLPTYYVFMAAWIPIILVTSEMSFSVILGNLFGVQTLTGITGAFNWYISGLVTMYILAPYFKHIADHNSCARSQFLFIIFLLLLSIPFWTVRNLIIIITRLPIFYIGTITAKACKNGYTLSKSWLYLSFLCIPVGFLLLYIAEIWAPNLLWIYGLHWYPFILITPGLCFLITKLAYWVETQIILSKILDSLNIIGKNSFEIYLVHIILFQKIIPATGYLNIAIHNNLLWIGLIPVIICMVILLKFIVNIMCQIKFKKTI